MRPGALRKARLIPCSALDQCEVFTSEPEIKGRLGPAIEVNQEEIEAQK